MATVRIYKVAELLGLSSQEAMSLLKQETGIDVKSASSSIEEIVARQFVERHARKRQIVLPPLCRVRKKALLQVGHRRQVERELGDARRAAPVGADA